MADDTERLVVALEARITAFEKSMQRAEATGTRSFKALQSQSASATKKLEADAVRASTRINQALASTSASVGTFGKAFAAGLVPAVTLSGIVKLIDSSTKVTNALKVTGLEGQNLKTVYDSLFASAQKNAAPIDALVTLYSRASGAAKDLNASQGDLLNFSDKIAVALRVSGQSAEESAGALLQLGQALGDGKIQAEEYNSLLDGARPILTAVAAGMKEAGGSVGTLTKLVKDGKVSSEAFFRAFLAGAPVLEAAVASSEETVSSHLVRLQNALVDAAGKFNQSAGAAKYFGDGIDQATAAINSANFDALIAQLQNVIATMTSVINAANAMAKSIGDAIGSATGLGTVGKQLMSLIPGNTVKAGGIYSTDAVQDRINDAFSDSGTSYFSGLTPEAIKSFAQGASLGVAPKTSRPAASKPEAVKPISLADYAVPGSSKSGTKGGGGGGSKADGYSREVDQIKERTAALQAETEAQASVNPLVNDFGEAQERAKTAAELLAKAQQSGTAAGKELASVSQLLSGNFDNLSPAAREQAQAMLSLADGYARAKAQSEQLQQSQEKIKQSAQEWNDAAKDASEGFVKDLIAGKSASEALANALQKVADKLLDSAFDSLFGGSNGNSGGLFGNLLSSIFGGGSSSAASLNSSIGFTGANTTLSSFLGLKNGGAFESGGVHAFAKGGAFSNQIVNTPTLFKFAKGTGMMGEAGPEAVMPLTRDSGGRLGVSAHGMGSGGGSQGVDVRVHVTNSVDENGNLQSFVTKTAHSAAQQATADGLDQYDQGFASKVDYYQNHKRRGVGRTASR